MPTKSRNDHIPQYRLMVLMSRQMQTGRLVHVNIKKNVNKKGVNSIEMFHPQKITRLSTHHCQAITEPTIIHI